MPAAAPVPYESVSADCPYAEWGPTIELIAPEINTIFTSSCLQTKGGTEARGITAQEFYARATNIHTVAYQLYSKDKAAFGNHLRFSWDHCSAHKSAEPDLALLPEQIVDLPKRSPDLHRVIESPHSRLHGAFRKALRADPRVRTVKDAIKLLQKVATDVITKDYIQKLVDGMPNTYRSVVQRGGDWAEKKYR